MSAVVVLSSISSGLVVLPAVTLPAAAARPIAPRVESLALNGIDRSGLGESPPPGHHDDEGRVQATEAHDSLAPVAVSGKVRTGTFSAVGVTWARAAVDDVAVQVRTRSNGRWSEWTEIEVQPNAAADAGSPEARTARAGTDPLYVGPSNAVQVRVDAGRVKPRDLRMVLVDPGASAADEGSPAGAGGPRIVGGAQAHAAETQPSYVSRAGWGADETLRSCTPNVSSTIKGGILHTTATGNDYTAAQSAAIMRSMYAYHTQSLGWCDLGYNFLVDKFGTLFEGRYGGVDKAVIGAHTGGFNTSTFGVSLIGNHDLTAPTSAMLATAQKVFAWKLGLSGLDPTGTATYTSAGGSATFYPAGTTVTKPVISGHRDYSTKSCPGDYAYPLLPSLRSGVAARLAPTVTKAPTSLTLITTPRSVPYGASTTLRGRLTTSTGTALAAKRVQIHVRPRGTTTWTLLSTRTTGANGTFSGIHQPRRNVDYLARFSGDGQSQAVARRGRTDVAAKISARFSTSSVRLGTVVTLHGTVTPAHAGQAVQRQQLVNGAWTTLARTPLTSTGTYSFRVKASYAGTKTYRVVKAADADHVAARSTTVTLAVR